MAKNFITNLVIGGKLNPSLQNAFNKASKLAGNTYSKIDKLSSIAGKAIGAIGLAAGAGSLAAVAKEGIELASSLTEVQNVVDTTFGKSAGQINKWSQTALRSFGLSELQAKQYSSTLGAMLKSSGLTGNAMVSMSEKLTGLSGDLASFYNISQDEAFQKIQSGISGETEPLRELGINMTVANLQAYALSKGVKTAYDKMDQASQVALRYSYLMEKSKDAQGDFAKTQGSFANQTRLLKTNFQQLIAKIMSGALPALSDLAQKANKAISSFTSDPARMQMIQDKIKGIIDRIGDVIDGASKAYSFIKTNWSTIAPIVWGIVAAMTAYKVATLGLVAAQKAGMIISALSKAWETASILIGWLRAGESLATVAQIALNAAMSANPIGLIVIALAALAGAVYLVVKNWNTIINALMNAWNWFKNLIKTIPDFALVLAGPLAPLLLLIKHFDKVKQVVGGAIDAVKKFFGFSGKDKPEDPGPNPPTGGTPKFAVGGIATKPSIFGEAGPEMAIPLQPGNRRSLALLDQTAGILGASKGGGIQITYAPQITGASLAEIEPALQENFEQFKAWFRQMRLEEEALNFG